MADKDKQGVPNPGQDVQEDVNSVASTMECTGLIPTSPTSEAEMESYADIYPVPEPAAPVNNGLHTEKGIRGDMTKRRSSR